MARWNYPQIAAVSWAGVVPTKLYSESVNNGEENKGIKFTSVQFLE